MSADSFHGPRRPRLDSEVLQPPRDRARKSACLTAPLWFIRRFLQAHGASELQKVTAE